MKSHINILIFTLAVLVGSFLVVGTASAATLAKPPNNLGLAGYWPMNEGTGTQVGDMSGNGNDGTITGATSVTGKRGNALSFNGSSDYVHRETFNNLPSSNMTLSVWVKTTSATVQYVMAQGRRPETVNGEYIYEIEADGTQLFWDYNSNYGYAATGFSNTSVADGQWHHIAFVKNGVNGTYYLDGQADGTKVASGDKSYITNDFSMGKNYRDNNNFFNGIIDEARVYNRALSAADVSKLYKSGRVTMGSSSADLDDGSTLENGLVGLWTMDGQDTDWASGTTNDRSDSGNNGTITNARSSPGKIGQSMYFDGSGDKIQTSSITNIPSGGSARTFAVWMKYDVGSTGGVIAGSNASSAQKYFIETVKVGSTWYLFTDGVNSANNIILTGSQIPTSGEWHHIAFTKDASDNWIYYLDGNNTKNGTFSVAINTNTPTSVTIGERLDVSGYVFNGSIDDVRIYDRALTQSEVNQLYNLGQSKVNVTRNTRLTDGLVGMWSFNGQDVDWDSNTAYDRAGQGYNGTISGARSTVGKVGQAMDFFGTKHYVGMGNIYTSMGMRTNLSVAGWFKTDTLAQPDENQGTVFSKTQYSVDNRMWTAYVNSSGINWYIYDDNNTAYGQFTSITLNEWHHFVGIFDSGTQSFYVDGVLVDSDVRGFSNLNESSANVYIGVADSGVNHWFDGQIDEVRIYDRALSADEVKQLYLMGN